MKRKSITIKGARENNLKNVSVEIPRDSLTVITGVSGSGKSSLAYNVIYGEGQRRFLQSLASSSRTSLANMDKPDVDMVMGLSPVISISQKRSNVSPRSSVGSMSDISNYVRLLYAILGKSHCRVCYEEIETMSINRIAEHITSLNEGTKVEILAPVNKIYGEDYDYLFTHLRNNGYRKFKIDNESYDDKYQSELDENIDYQIEVFIDEFKVYKKNYKQILDSIEKGLEIGSNYIKFEIESTNNCDKELLEFKKNFIKCDHNMITGSYLPKNFSANDVSGACKTCHGLGTYMVTEPSLLIKDENKSMKESPFYVSQFELNDRNGAARLHSLAMHYDFSIDTPFKDLKEETKNILFYGTNGDRYELLKPTGERYDEQKRRTVSYEGLINYVTRVMGKKVNSDSGNKTNDRLFAVHSCPDCKGKKLQQDKFLVKLDGIDIYEFNDMHISNLLKFIENIEIPDGKIEAAQEILNEINIKLKFLEEIGLGYLNLGRGANSLSGGETQRLRLASQLGSNLMGMLYILDEPSIGLHEKDTFKIIDTMKSLRDMGNTVIVVEHDMETIKNADYIIEMGPAAGVHGGNIVASGSYDEFVTIGNSLTAEYLNGTKKVVIPSFKREGSGKFINIKGAKENNLQDIDVSIPLGTFICVTGVSGSGKSTLIEKVLYKSIMSKFHDSRIKPGRHDSIDGLEFISDVRFINQSPIGKSSRSNPATYVNIYDKIRQLFADTNEAKSRGYDVSSFSFNVRGGRCETCMGEGRILTELQFMQDIYSECHSCKGKRYKCEILEVKYKGKNIADILDLTIEEAVDFFNDIKTITVKLSILNELGLGYLKLGQSASTLSGGEAQRIKLGKELGKIKKNTGNLYILDEPTTGLHIHDIEKLLLSINKLVNQGNTVLVIEHNLDFIKVADHLIDIGPNAGKYGGKVVVSGKPEDIVNCEESHTARYLKKYL